MTKQTKKMTRDVKIKQWGSKENGAAVVEFAVIVLVLLFITFGILEFAFIFYQRHFIENAAREGMRVGVKANNFSCFAGTGDPGATCSPSVDRKIEVQQKIKDYLSPLYQITNPDGQIDVQRLDIDDDAYLKVTIKVTNFFPTLLSGLIPNFDQEDISYSITGRYEDPDEY